mmetsp:Transcript_62916/g.101917  ORF Transcript_62916/g.101917 Transcript_62916/m.101917 type:complete len:206 (+) Transcript_62916:158-775(+)
MGKYVKKTQVHKVKTTAPKGAIKQEAKRKKVKARQQKAKKRGLKKAVDARKVARQEAAGADPSDAMMTTVDPSSRSAAEKLVSFLERARTDAKATDALKKIIRAGPEVETMSVAVGYCAGRGLANCVRLLIEQKASVNVQDPMQPVGRQTPLQLAAARGHVNAVRLLVESGADKAGAVEAAQELAKLGAVFAEERKAILCVLGQP